MDAYRAILDNCAKYDTLTLKGVARGLNKRSDVDSDIVINRVLMTLEGRMPEEEFLAFCEELLETMEEAA